MSYLEKCQARVTELNSLVADFRAIKDNKSVDVEHRYDLVTADACLGRIRELFAELGISFYLGEISTRFLSHQYCMDCIESEIDLRLKSLNGLLPQQD